MSFQEKFEQILANNDFSRLTPYTDPQSWDAMTEEERELLGIIFVKQAEHQFKKGDTQVIETLQLSSRVAPKSSRVFFRQGLVLASQDHNMGCLLAAAEAFERAVYFDPSCEKAWHAWGNILVRMGSFYQESNYFPQADEKFKQAENQYMMKNTTHFANLYWHWGVCWYFQGKLSGEAADYLKALAKFNRVQNSGLEESDFCNDYGNVFVELASLLNRKDLFYEAIHQYKKAVKLQPDHCESWHNLAQTYHRLYRLKGNEEYFALAEESFQKAAELKPEMMNIWLNWAEHYAFSGKAHRNIQLINKSLDKFEKAATIEADHPLLLMLWGEAKMLWASEMDDFEQLCDAEAKIAKSLESCHENPDAWFLYGTCLIEFGRYFEDDKYYHKAIEKFQYGLSLNQNHHPLCYGLALAHFSIGELQTDVSMIEKSIRLFGRAMEFGGQDFPEFWNDWGIALLKLGEMVNDKKYIEAAIERFEQAIIHRGEGAQLGPADLEYFYNYGCAWDFLGDLTEDAACYEKAIHILTYVLQHDSDYTHARYNLAMTLAHLGEMNSDLECFQRAISLFQEILDEENEDEIAWNDFGETLLNVAFLIHDPNHLEQSQKFFEQAEHKFLHAVALGSTEALYNLACLYAMTANYPAAMHYLEKAQNSGSLPCLDDLLHDEWLEGLRNTADFRNFLFELTTEQEFES